MKIRTLTPVIPPQKIQRGVNHIGVTCVFICHDGRGNFVLHKRSQNCRDELGRWDNGGGSLEFGEDFETAIRREVKEEYDAEAIAVRFLAASNVLRKNGGLPTHWVALVFAVQVDPGQVKIGEPEKMDKLGWFTAANLPSPLHSQFRRHFAYFQQAFLIPDRVSMSVKPKDIYPKVGVGVMIIKDGKILLGQRVGTHGANQYAWPGGHMEYMESYEQTARREVKEETGLEIDNVRFLRLYNLKEYAPKHYVDVGLVADWKSGEPKVMEPEKCEGWEWFDLDNLPSPLFATVPSFIEAYKTGRNFWDQ